MGDDQIITQVREALELSRANGCADSYLETMFNIAIQAAKRVKTDVMLKTYGMDSVPGKALEKLKTLCPIAGCNAVVIGNGQMGRLAAHMLIREKANVTVTLREYKRGVIIVPEGANTVGYSERYEAVGRADILISATTSPHFTISRDELAALDRLPGIIVDMAVPRDIEPSVGEIPGVNLLTIDDISGQSSALPPESAAKIDAIIKEHIGKYNRWRAYKENAPA